MTAQELIAGCSTDVLVVFAESLHIYTGLLTVATLCGVLSGVLSAALLYVFCLKPLLLTRQVSKSHATSVSPPHNRTSYSVVICHYSDTLLPHQIVKGHNARRLLEPHDGELDVNSSSRKEAPTATANDKVFFSLTSNPRLGLFVTLYAWMLNVTGNMYRSLDLTQSP